MLWPFDAGTRGGTAAGALGMRCSGSGVCVLVLRVRGANILGGSSSSQSLLLSRSTAFICNTFAGNLQGQAGALCGAALAEEFR